jgi:hypothetical protein
MPRFGIFKECLKWFSIYLNERIYKVIINKIVGNRKITVVYLKVVYLVRYY